MMPGRLWRHSTGTRLSELGRLAAVLDRGLPTVSAARSPAANAAGWNRDTVTVTLTSGDGLSGVVSTEYRAQGAGAWTAYTAPFIAPEGATKYEYRCTDAAGNVSEAGAVDVSVDTRRPQTKAPTRAAVRMGAYVKLAYKVIDASPGSGQARVRIRVKTMTGKTVKTMQCGTRAANKTLTHRFRCKLRKGTYRFYVYATDLAGNTQSKIGRNVLRVR